MPFETRVFSHGRLAPGSLERLLLAVEGAHGAASSVSAELVSPSGGRDSQRLDEILEWCDDQRSRQVSVRATWPEARLVVLLSARPAVVTVGVTCADPALRDRIFRVLHVEHLPHRSAETQAPRVFVGHGQDHQWRDLVDHLRDHHGLPVLFYEAAARAGRRNADVLESLARQADLAVLVHTPDCGDPDGRRHASDNVIHETGLFQGLLGTSRTIIVREEGCTSFANVEGVNELRFPKAGIRSVFGDVVATVRREFAAKGYPKQHREPSRGG